MLRNIATAGKRFLTMSHERSINVNHYGNKIVFDVPLYFERGIMIKDTRVDGNRLIINAIKRLDVELAEQKMEEEKKLAFMTEYEGCCPKK